MENNVTQKFLKCSDPKVIPTDYVLTSAYFVNLAERYAIDARLIGKSISFHYGEFYLSIVFPSVIIKEGYPELEIPGLLESIGIDIDCWGKVNNYSQIDKPETYKTWLSTVLVKCFAKQSQMMIKSIDLQKLARKVVYALQIINPDAIRISSDEVINDVCEVKDFVSFSEGGKRLIEGSISVVIDDGKKQLFLKDIHYALQNINRSISAPYEMLGNARMNMARHDTRASILNCATSIEVMLKKMISDYFVETHTTVELQDYILRQADGYSKLVELCKKMKLSLGGLPNVQETVMKIRNRVIHGGYVPSFEEANKAYKDTRESLKVMNVPIFE